MRPPVKKFGEVLGVIFFVSLKNLAKGMKWVIDEIFSVYAYWYVILVVLNTGWMFFVDYLRSKLWFQVRAQELNNFLSSENDLFYQKKWLWWSANPYSMGVQLNFEKKLIEPLLVWNYEKILGSGDKVKIEKVIRLLNGTEDDDELPPYLRGLTEQQWDNIESEEKEVWDSSSDGTITEEQDVSEDSENSDMMSRSEESNEDIPMRTAKADADSEESSESGGDSDTEIFPEEDVPADTKEVPGDKKKALQKKLDFLKKQMEQVDSMIETKKLK